MPDARRHERPDGAAAVRLLCDVHAAPSAPETSGVLWKLVESGRQLDANLVRLAAGERIGTHAEPDLDVLVLIVTGEGVMRTPEGELSLTAGALMWLPHGSTRSITAGIGGLTYVTVHRRRPGMQIRPHPDSAPASSPRHRGC